MNYTQIETPNSRYLHSISNGFCKDWSLVIGKINAFVGQQSKLSFASEPSILYFFESPEFDEFFHSAAWVGREIIGIPQLDPEGDFKVFDLDRGRAFRFKLNENLMAVFFPERLKNAYQIAKMELEKSGVEPVSTWRLVIFDENIEGSLKIDVFIDFFSDDR